MTTSVSVTCLCGEHRETLELNSKLPVPVASCSCSSCRYTTGVLYFSCLPLASRPELVDNLTKYDSSSKLTRYFCGQCGSPMFIEMHADSSWSVCSGVVDVVEGHQNDARLSLEHVAQHEFVDDTKDGGLAICLAQIDGHPVPLFLQGPESAKVEGTTEELLAKLGRDNRTANDSNELQAGCHCEGVSFRVTRPNAASRTCSSPWPDLVVPYHSSSSENREDVKWWLSENDTKYRAGTCACRSCRLGSGSPIQAWAFVPKANILKLDGKPLDYDMGTLKQIQSSSGCYREFCSRCGATVFWHCLERPDLVDVSVGLLRAPEGARATSWLDWWTGRVSFKEDALDKPLIENLERGLVSIK